MEKLTYELLSPYLPYKLQICYRVLDLENGNPDTDNPDDRMKDCIMEMNGARLDNCLLPETDRWYDKNAIFKPLLIPLSLLTIENWVDVFNAGNDMKDLGKLVVCEKYGRTHIQIDNDTKFSFNPNNNSFYTLYPFHQLVAFNKLFELQADLFGLIEKGLAINKLTIKP